MTLTEHVSALDNSHGLKEVQINLKGIQSRAVRADSSPNLPRTNRIGERRSAIVDALRRCIREKGYAPTSLADLATAAGMSPSHLLYYFSGKEAVFEQYARTLADEILGEVLARVADPPEQQIDALADYFFGTLLERRIDQGGVLELFGQAVHRPTLRRIKADFDRRMKAHLTVLFRQTPGRGGLGAEDAAELAFALLVGFYATTFFDTRLEVARARALFRADVRRLAGLPQSNRERPRRKPAAPPALRRKR